MTLTVKDANLVRNENGYYGVNGQAWSCSASISSMKTTKGRGEDCVHRLSTSPICCPGSDEGQAGGRNSG